MSAKAKATPQTVLDAIESNSKVNTFSFKKLPAEEAEFQVWKFDVTKKIRARLLPLTLKDDMEDVVDRYLGALKHCKAIEIHPEIKSIDAAAAVGLSEAIDQHPKKHLIERELMNDDVVDAPKQCR